MSEIFRSIVIRNHCVALITFFAAHMIAMGQNSDTNTLATVKIFLEYTDKAGIPFDETTIDLLEQYPTDTLIIPTTSSNKDGQIEIVREVRLDQIVGLSDIRFPSLKTFPNGFQNEIRIEVTSSYDGVLKVLSLDGRKSEMTIVSKGHHLYIWGGYCLMRWQLPVFMLLLSNP